MNKTDIDWADATWNPISGCLNGCEYCYARGIARRFEGYNADVCDDMGIDCVSHKVLGRHDLTEPLYRLTKQREIAKASYPFGFLPTFHRYRLDEPAKIKKPQTIFVGSMADMFGEWVPDEWIQEVFKACEAAPWHRYLFLTKNPSRYNALHEARKLPLYDNFYFGGTRTGQDSDSVISASVNGNVFLSLEPLVAPIEYGNAFRFWNWVIIGAETGNRKGKTIPKREWIADIVAACEAENVPVFLKNNLAKIWGEPLIQQFPWST
ncbi:MAG: phage Gp37/Gp68 family protein [Defluviitaleaceae bacterium]|nr:phage Gp37/Gp68 family protein [Defluviitaleaceae bacterium]